MEDLKDKMAEIIESYLTETDTSDIYENADYHGRILATIITQELAKELDKNR